MQKNNDFFSDFARLASSAGGTLLEMRREVENMVAVQMEKWQQKTGGVTRDEFEAVRDMAQQARLENETLKARIAVLEGAQASPAAKKPAAAKPTASAKTGPTTGTSGKKD